jgi:hypothetical protein
MLKDKAYKGKSMRYKVEENGLIAIVPPKETRKEKWGYVQIIFFYI